MSLAELKSSQSIEASTLSLLAGEDEDGSSLLHELKTPLASLLGYARMVRGNWERMTGAHRDECFEIVERQGKRLLGLMEGLLQTRAMPETPPRRLPVELQRIIHEAIETARGLGGDHEFDVMMPGHDLGLFGDDSALEHIFTNLLDNAVKYSPDRSTIRVRVEERAKEIIVRIVNGGDGIAAAELPYVFDRFRRASTSVKGTGLGLSIVRRLVAAHGGTVQIDSSPAGTTIAVVGLPRRSAA